MCQDQKIVYCIDFKKADCHDTYYLHSVKANVFVQIIQNVCLFEIELAFFWKLD